MGSLGAFPTHPELPPYDFWRLSRNAIRTILAMGIHLITQGGKGIAEFSQSNYDSMT